jgi:gliding motility-associated lipoprotein GldH
MRKSLQTRIHFTLLIALVALLAACDGNKVYEDYKTLDNNQWNAADIAKFNVSISDNKIPYNYFIDVRVQNSYSWANLYLFMKTLYPDGKVSIDTIECYLADVDGRWLGTRSGNSIDNRIMLRSKFRFEETGQYSFEFEQAMRDTVLKGVENFGIRIEKAE